MWYPHKNERQFQAGAPGGSLRFVGSYVCRNRYGAERVHDVYYNEHFLFARYGEEDREYISQEWSILLPRYIRDMDDKRGWLSSGLLGLCCLLEPQFRFTVIGVDSGFALDGEMNDD